jgi:SAM-dependent methyltransferase
MLEQNKKTFTKEAVTYGDASYWRPDEEVLVQKYFTKPNAKVLVLGCGGGRTLIPLYEKGFDITAIDIIPEMVAEARAHVGERKMHIDVMDAAKLSFDDASFDYVFFPFHGIDYVAPDIYAAVQEAGRVLTHDGVFIFNSHNRWYLKKLPHFFDGTFSDYRGLITYRTCLRDYFKLRTFFKKVRMVQRISLLPMSLSGWKDVVYKIFFPFDKSTYFICKYPKK